MPSLKTPQRLFLCLLFAAISLLQSGYGQAGLQDAKRSAPLGAPTVEGLVFLSVNVFDKKGPATGLHASDFTVYEDDKPQQISFFSTEDAPVSIGIVVDNSGSMREKRAAITLAIVNLVRASNPQDEFFVVNFNDESYLDQDFTNNINVIHEALDRVDSRGGTALYDAVIASANHLTKAAKREERFLLVVTDGQDNDSRDSLEQAIRAVQEQKGPRVYTIGILDEAKLRRARHALEALTLESGGVPFFSKHLSELTSVCQSVARDIRSRYMIAYKPSTPRTSSHYRYIKVTAQSAASKDLVVRVKAGYFAGQEQPQK